VDALPLGTPGDRAIGSVSARIRLEDFENDVEGGGEGLDTVIRGGVGVVELRLGLCTRGDAAIDWGLGFDRVPFGPDVGFC